MKNLPALVILVFALSGCTTFFGSGDKGGYQGPAQYAKYFQKGNPENVMDDIIVQMSQEAWRRGYLPHGQLYKWDWDKLIRISEDQVVGWKYGFPLVENPSASYPYGAIATASKGNNIRIGNDPNYVYKRSLWVHEGGHLLAYYNGISGDHHLIFPDFFRRNNGR